MTIEVDDWVRYHNSEGDDEIVIVHHVDSVRVNQWLVFDRIVEVRKRQEASHAQ